MFIKKSFNIALAGFIALNIALYIFILLFNGYVSFDVEKYTNQSHHYFQDARSEGGEFNLLRALGVWDSQWYLRIADDGYPRDLNSYMGALTYAFFPLYPLVLVMVNMLFQNLELTAFIVMNVILLADFFSLYYVGTKLFSSTIALRAIFLLYLFPFSIFFRSYYTEGIFLLILIWFSYFLIKKKWFLSTLLLSLLFVTRPNGPFMEIVFIIFLFKAIREKKISITKSLLYIFLSTILFFGWLYFCYYMTYNPFYWHEVQAVWFKAESPLSALIQNITSTFSFFTLPFHTARQSRVDVLMIIAAMVLLIKSRKVLRPELWWISLIICIVPLLFRDTMSYSRYQMVSFPLFFYLASICKGKMFIIICAIFLFLLFFTSLFLVNWHWVG